jgi:hypothetical protein
MSKEKDVKMVFGADSKTPQFVMIPFKNYQKMLEDLEDKADLTMAKKRSSEKNISESEMVKRLRKDGFNL